MVKELSSCVFKGGKEMNSSNYRQRILGQFLEETIYIFFVKSLFSCYKMK